MTANESRSPRRRVVRWLLRQIERGLALFGLGMLIYFTCFHTARIATDSMAPTLQGEKAAVADLVLTERISYWFRQPRRWEVITFRNDDGIQIMKRVIGLPGERVGMRRGGRIFIDGREIHLPEQLGFLKYFPYGNLLDNEYVPCGDGYYVLGDYSRDSVDSRFNGPVRPDQLIGRAWLILAPSPRRGFIN
jgi:signal peptidase I